MKVLRVFALLAAVSVALPASAGELTLAFKDGRVTLKASDVTLRQVLNEWARLGQTRVVGLEKVTGSPITIELTDVPEKQALEILLRSLAGYMAAPRVQATVATASRFDRLVLLPTSVASAAPVGAPARPAAFVPPQPVVPFDEPDPNDSPNPPGVPVFNQQMEAVNPTAAPFTGNPDPNAPQQVPLSQSPLRPYQSPNDPNASPATPVNGPGAQPAGPLVTDRPGVIPLPQPQPRP